MPENVFRTPRTHSVEIGGANVPKSPTTDPNYDPAAGTPSSVAGGVYEDEAQKALPVAGPKPRPTPKPFK